MSGLVKAKKYNWKDSNVALFGSDQDRKAKKESADTEPAWQGVGQKAELKIWRIVNFQVTVWPEEDYGKFFSGDSYIILNTYKADPNSEELSYDVHFWIGSNSSQDEYGTVAYKTVELDTHLDDKAVQHREVEGYESDLFHSYFPSIVIMEGGAESGFRHVEPKSYQPRLLHFSGQKKHITVKEVPLCPTRLHSDDVFLLDLGLQLYQWNGSGCNKDERFKAMQYLQHLKSERGNATTETLEEDDTPKTHAFYDALIGEDEPDDDLTDDVCTNSLHRVSDAGGHIKSEKLKEGTVTLEDFDSADVFILDTGNECFVWIGNAASPDEKQNGIGYAHMHLMKTTHPLVPIHIVKEGQTNKAFSAALAA